MRTIIQVMNVIGFNLGRVVSGLRFTNVSCGYMRGMALVMWAVILSGCATTGPESPAVKRQKIIDMRNSTLNDLYRHRPGVKPFVTNSPGYAVFSNANVNVLLASFSGGYGVVTNNGSGEKTYMNMAEAGVGVGLGVKDFRAVFVFHDNATMAKFIEQGWVFGGHADAAAKAGDKGGAVSGEAVFDGITVYQLTKSGLALQATVKGTKYWKADELN